MRNNKRRLSISLSLILLAFELTVARVFGDSGREASSYTFITVDVPTSTGRLGFTTLADVNEKGEIAGGFTDSNLEPHGFVLDKRGHPTEIQCSKKVVSTEPQSINKHGAIAGVASVVTDRIKISVPPFKTLITKISGFFRDKKGKCAILDFPGANLTEATGVNDDGQVVGDFRDSSGNFHGFFWDAGLFLMIHIPFPGATFTSPTAINNLGQIIGYYFDSIGTASFPNGQTRGFLYDNGIFTAFDFPDGVATFPVDINDHGHILGIYADANFVVRSFLLEDGSFTRFDVPYSDVITTQVSGINNKGVIVGRYLQPNPSDPVNPFLSQGFIALPRADSKLIAKRP